MVYRLLLGALWTMCVSAAIATPTILPTSGPMKVSALFPRTLNLVPTQGFYFLTDTPQSVTCGTTTTTTATFVIPKVDPSNPNADNPAYRDHVNAVMLAFAMGKPMYVWYDGCLTGYPRVVGVDIYG